MSYLVGIGKAVSYMARAVSKVSNSIALRLQSYAMQPGRRSIKRGVLVPGDSPPTGNFAGLDYRNVLLSRQLDEYRSGEFPLGRIQDPGSDRPGFPVYLSWEDLQRHSVIIGPSRSGKTYNILAPWIVAAQSHGIATIAVDVKGDLLNELAEARQRLGVTLPGRGFLWDIADPLRSRSWSPLREVQTQLDASQLALAFLGEVDPNDHQKFFAERDHRWLRGLIWLAVNAFGRGVHPRSLYEMVVFQDSLRKAVALAPHAARELADLVQFVPDRFTEATAGLSNRLSWLADPSLTDMLSGEGSRSFQLADVFKEQAVLIVGARQAGGERSAAAAATILNLARLRALERFADNSAPVFWVLDEAASYAHRIQLAQMLDLLSGANSPVCVGLQDVTQLGDIREQERMLANCDTMVVLRGVSTSSAEFMSRRLGTTITPLTTMTMGENLIWQPSVSHTEKPILGPREIQAPPVGQYGGTVHLRSVPVVGARRDSVPVFLVSFV